MGLADAMKTQDMVLVIAGVVSGLVLTLGITKVMSRSKQSSKSKLKGRFKLYHTHTFRSSRVLWAVYELGLESQCEVVSYHPHLSSEEERTWYKANVQPNGLVPGLELPSGEFIYESSAICLFLASCVDKLQPPPDELHHFYSWSLYSVCTMEPFIQVLMEERFLTRESRKNRERQRLKTAQLMESVTALEKHMANRKYICGKRFTMADVIVGYTLMFAAVMNSCQLFVDHSHVRDYLERLQARPHFVKCMGTPNDWVEKAEELRQIDVTELV